MRNKSNGPVEYVKVIVAGAVLAFLAIATIFIGFLAVTNPGESKSMETESLAETQTETQIETRIESETLAEAEEENETESEFQMEAQVETEIEIQREEEPETQENVEGPLVVIDAGHQGPGQDMSGYEAIAPGSEETKPRIVSGTQGTTTGLCEYELNLNVALHLRDILEERGYRVIMTRETHDINISNIERAEVANSAGADIMVRIHANGDNNSSVAGALTMSPSAANPYVGSMYEQCNALSRCIIDSYCAATGLANDGILEVDNMTGINWCQVPVTIVEMGFMTNPGDDTYMADSDNQYVMAEGIANGIDQYFGR